MRAILWLLTIVAVTTSARAQTEAGPPDGPPPPLQVSDPGWYAQDPDEPEASASDESQATPDLHRHLALGAQWFFVQDKIMPGLSLRGGKQWFWVHAETSFVFNTRSVPTVDDPVLGSQFGAYVALSPLNRERVELHLGIGGDFYWLWGIHGDEWQVAFSTRVSGHFWLTRSVGAFASARAYPASTRGLELGTTREGEAGLPVLLSLGVEWRPR